MKAFGALEIALRSRTLRSRLRKISLQTAHLRLEGTWIDLKQEVALTNNRAFLEVHALQVAGNARAHLDCIDSFKAAGELITVADLLADNFRYAHLRRRWSLRLSRTGTTGIWAGESRQADDQHQPGQEAVVLTLSCVLCFQVHVPLPGCFLRVTFRFQRCFLRVTFRFQRLMIYVFKIDDQRTILVTWGYVTPGHNMVYNMKLGIYG